MGFCQSRRLFDYKTFCRTLREPYFSGAYLKIISFICRVIMFGYDSVECLRTILGLKVKVKMFFLSYLMDKLLVMLLTYYHTKNNLSRNFLKLSS